LPPILQPFATVFPHLIPNNNRLDYQMRVSDYVNLWTTCREKKFTPWLWYHQHQYWKRLLSDTICFL